MTYTMADFEEGAGGLSERCRWSRALQSFEVAIGVARYLRCALPDGDAFLHWRVLSSAVSPGVHRRALGDVPPPYGSEVAKQDLRHGIVVLRACHAFLRAELWGAEVVSGRRWPDCLQGAFLAADAARLARDIVMAGAENSDVGPRKQRAPSAEGSAAIAPGTFLCTVISPFHQVLSICKTPSEEWGRGWGRAMGALLLARARCQQSSSQRLPQVPGGLV